jgi:hypothetical protein
MSCRLESNGQRYLFRLLWTQKRQACVNSPIGDIHTAAPLRVLQWVHMRGGPLACATLEKQRFPYFGRI